MMRLKMPAKTLESTYNRALRTIADFISEHHTWSTDEELARQANLSKSTVYRLFSGITKAPAFRTVYKLALAGGVSWNCRPNGTVTCKVVHVTDTNLRRARAA